MPNIWKWNLFLLCLLDWWSQWTSIRVRHLLLQRMMTCQPRVCTRLVGSIHIRITTRRLWQLQRILWNTFLTLCIKGIPTHHLCFPDLRVLTKRILNVRRSFWEGGRLVSGIAFLSECSCTSILLLVWVVHEVLSTTAITECDLAVFVLEWLRRRLDPSVCVFVWVLNWLCGFFKIS